MKKLICLALIGLALASCSTWPKIYLGQSDGWLMYQSGTRNLEVHWNTKNALQGYDNKSEVTDTVTVTEIVN